MTPADFAIAVGVLALACLVVGLIVAIYRVAHAWFMTALNGMAEDIR